MISIVVLSYKQGAGNLISVWSGLDYSVVEALPCLLGLKGK